jgi:hypothetical protein
MKPIVDNGGIVYKLLPGIKASPNNIEKSSHMLGTAMKPIVDKEGI